MTQYRQLARLARPPEDVWLLLGRTLLQRNMARPPDKREWGELEQVLRRAEQLEMLVVPAAVLRTDVLLAQGKPDAARAALENVRDRKPDQIELWTALANLTARRGDLVGANRILSAARQKLGDRIELRLTALALGIGLDDRDARAKLLAYEKDLQTLKPDDQRRLLAALAEVYYRLGFPDEGVRLTRELVARQPLDLPAAIVVLDLTLLGGDEALQLARHRRVAETGGRRRNLVALRRSAATAPANAARRQEGGGRGATIARGDHESAARLVAGGAAGGGAVRVEPRRGRCPSKPTPRAVEQGERQPDVIQRLMELLVAQGRAVEADDVMSKAQQQLIPHGRFARFAAETALRVRQYGRAASLALLAVPADSRDPSDYVWLGQVLTAAGRRPEAEEALRHALAIRDNLPEPWVALVTFYANDDRVKEADDALRTMADKLSSSKLPLALALCEEALGRLEPAEKHYLEARTNQPSDGVTRQRLASFYLRLQRTQPAEAALRDLLDPTLRFSPGTAATNVAWARRQLALLRADSGDEAGYQEAQALLAANGDSADMRAALFVKATRPNDRAAGAVRAREDVEGSAAVAGRAIPAGEAVRSGGRLERAHEQLVALLELDRRNPEYLAYFIAALLRQQRAATRRKRG